MFPKLLESYSPGAQEQTTTSPLLTLKLNRNTRFNGVQLKKRRYVSILI